MLYWSCNYYYMNEESWKFPLKRKPLNHKSISGRISKSKKVATFLSPIEQNYNQQQRKNIASQKQAEKNIGQNISLIAKKQEGSFISNRQDHSLDSFDKMIIGVDEELDLEDQNTFNSKENQLNYTLLYNQFEKLVKGSKKSKSELSQEIQIESENKFLGEELFQPEEQKMKQSSFQISMNGVSSLKVSMKQKMDELKEMRRQKIANLSDQNISLRLLAGNLSQIHEQQIHHNTSMGRMDPIQEEFIDFVSKNNETSKINISKIQNNTLKQEKKINKNKGELNMSLKQPEDDQVVAMLENELGRRRQTQIQEQSIDQRSLLSKPQDKKQSYQKQNYNQILRELDENEDKKLDYSQINISSIFSKRQEWINNRKDRSQKWKVKQLNLLSKMKQIIYNPYVDYSDEDEQQS